MSSDEEISEEEIEEEIEEETVEDLLARVEEENRRADALLEEREDSESASYLRRALDSLQQAITEAEAAKTKRQIGEQIKAAVARKRKLKTQKEAHIAFYEEAKQEVDEDTSDTGSTSDSS